METSKQKAIREAYGEHWEEVKDYVTEDGWCKTRKRINYDEIIKSLSIELYNESTYNWRPKSLQGIETNNGWIRIESEADLPKEDCDCRIRYTDGTKSIDRFYISHNQFLTTNWKYITHYKELKEEINPIY